LGARLSAARAWVLGSARLGLGCSGSARVGEDCLEREPEDQEVEPQAAVLDVVQVALQLRARSLK